MRRRGMVAGAAVASHHANKQQQQAQQQSAADQQAAYDQGLADAQAAQAQAAPAEAPAQDPMDAKIAELEKLGKLHDSGVLTDEEFAAEKAKVLGS